MKIIVSKKDIKLGLKTIVSNTKCPVARAIRRAGLKGVSVGVNWARSVYGGDISLPKEVVTAISHMCDTRTMEPFSFSFTKQQVNNLRG